jgi:hypothetical protein
MYLGSPGSPAVVIAVIDRGGRGDGISPSIRVLPALTDHPHVFFSDDVFSSIPPAAAAAAAAASLWNDDPTPAAIVEGLRRGHSDRTLGCWLLGEVAKSPIEGVVGPHRPL